MIDLAKTVEAKVDQLTADELLAGPRKILITNVTGNDNPEQPVSIHFEGDSGKPFKPCKTMRRVLMHMWGRDASQFAGRSLVLFRDEAVKFGGLQVGGVRISHASHIERDMAIPVTMKRGQKAPVKVKALKAEVTPLKAVESDAKPTEGFDFDAFENTVKLGLLSAENATETTDWWNSLLTIRKAAGAADKERAIAIATKVKDKIAALEAGNAQEAPF